MSAELKPCPECTNEYLAIRKDIYKDQREFVYCDCCGCMAPKTVWNLIARAALPVQAGEGEALTEQAIKALRDQEGRIYQSIAHLTDQAATHFASAIASHLKAGGQGGEDGARFAWAISHDDNAEALHASVMSHGRDVAAIRADIDAARAGAKASDGEGA